MLIFTMSKFVHIIMKLAGNLYKNEAFSLKYENKMTRHYSPFLVETISKVNMTYNKSINET